jgi:hypothetical protein
VKNRWAVDEAGFIAREVEIFAGKCRCGGCILAIWDSGSYADGPRLQGV